jgi:hypothetical protein
MLIHQIPPKPNYFRVKVGRRLQRLGAVAVKNSVYVLPGTEGTLEDLQWVLREIHQGGGDASLCEAHFIDGLSNEQIQSLFHQNRNADYAQISEEARSVGKAIPRSGKIAKKRLAQLKGEVMRLERRLAEVSTIDFYGASGREVATGLVSSLQARLSPTPAVKPSTSSSKDPGDYRGRIWVTRQGIRVDRMASAWLIRRFVDGDARFKFVLGKDYRPEPGELRFDMFGGEFTHEGDHCTFEVLLSRFSLSDSGLREIGEIVHDVDLKDAKFGRQDALGFERMVAGIALAHKEDNLRLERACAVLDDLYEYYRRKPGKRRLV